MGTQDWRIGTNGEDYLRGQNKQAAIENRRPSIRKASDLVGPGIGSSATRITDFNDALAVFNGYYSAEPGALTAPNATDSFVGVTVMDDELGGRQEFTSLETGVTYTRIFLRNPADPTSISFGLWKFPETPSSMLVVGGGADTALSTGVLTQALMPDMQFFGDPGAFARGSKALTITRPGVYSGYAFLRTVTAVTLDNLVVDYPMEASQVQDQLFNYAGYDGHLLPLHFATTIDTGQVRFFAKQSSGSGATFQVVRFALTRVSGL